MRDNDQLRLLIDKDHVHMYANNANYWVGRARFGVKFAYDSHQSVKRTSGCKRECSGPSMGSFFSAIEGKSCSQTTEDIIIASPLTCMNTPLTACRRRLSAS